MNSVLIIKQGAAGDVVRTTTLLHLFRDSAIDWLVLPENKDILPSHALRAVYTNPRSIPQSASFDLVVSLEDDGAVLTEVFSRVRARQVFGSYSTGSGGVAYTEDSNPWFDMSLVSRFGLAKANGLKWQNRRSYQDILFACLGRRFAGEKYILPEADAHSDIRGDIATASRAGARWPLKSWYGFAELAAQFSERFIVNELPLRPSLIQHLVDVRNHRVVVTNDSLPMHLALGLGIPTVALFTCTSPWEIYDYGILTSITSPVLGKYFYSRDDAEEGRKAISVERVAREVRSIMDAHTRDLTE